ncbi:exodeoxyribonuclease V subunit gamma [Aliiglaciecola sp. CAU 1673]|uniref:exodeoxyribonuclease V subunit gamma n=1 Tax=Aliiglaciecola sp. CAU 1673 TaxID=3032595 RepID=UPI0023DCB9BB|nr:exodeoxyribonuclease V subunit gamma [Aliiglaciecola sp. CAU 1673]MDF2179815.1 exodeoxyribonuclease V subunit gamma [Aliiglaciecola sp. CAU 1673]
MLQLVQSNKMEVLAERLCQCLAQAQGTEEDWSVGQTILVQSPGMAQWLKLQVAERLGIAANLAFPLPSSFIWQLYTRLIPDLPKDSAFSKAAMTWKLMGLLPQLCQQPAFAPVAGYLLGDDGFKLFQLSHKIADVFDQYLVYRPDWILAWEQGEDRLPDVDIGKQPWQPILWRALVDKTKALGESPWHRANLHQALLERLAQAAPDDLPQALFVFGISALPKQQLEVLSALAEHIPVYLFWSNPSEHYWGDVVDLKRKARMDLKRINGEQEASWLDVGNPLLSSWGRLGQEFLDMLLEVPMQQHDEFVAPKASSLLSHLQQEVFDLTHRGSSAPLSAEELLGPGTEFPKIAIQPDDRSLSLHSCHSRQRELEVLHDQLLAFLDAHPQLHPGDIVVMMPDVGQYAALIHGVFGTKPKELSLPYAISDRGLGQESPLLGAFLTLMGLHKQRLTLSEVLDILQVPAIARRFTIDGQEFELLKRWLTDAGVRWGLDGKDKARWDLPPEAQNTWLFGLERLLCGYAMDTPLYQDDFGLIAPFEDLEGQASAALGKFIGFMRVITWTLDHCQKEAPLSDKLVFARDLITRLFAPEDEEETYLVRLQEALVLLEQHQPHFDWPIAQDIFQQAIDEHLQERGVGQRFLAGAINFCTLMPMRSIPFKLVCLLGMNDGDYPRQVLPMGFDLMQHAKPRQGDRSRRLDDKYLFLEALLSAREALYISYIGKSERDNSERMPSVLVSELVEYCRQVYCLDGGQAQDVKHHLCRQHPLQPFAKDYFQGANEQNLQSNLQLSYQPLWLNLAKTLEQGAAPSAPFVGAPLSNLTPESDMAYEDWLSFFQNPAKGFFQLRWQVQFKAVADDIADEEPFVLSGLPRYLLREKLLSGQDQGSLLTRMSAQGVLPVGESGKLALNTLQSEYQALASQLHSFEGTVSPRRISVALEIDGLLIQGHQDRVFGRRLVLYRAGKVAAKHRLMLWLRLLVLSAQGEALDEAVLVGHETKPLVLAAPSQEQARGYLSEFVTAWREGHARPLPFFVETAWLWLTTGDKDKCLDKFYGNQNTMGEGQEPHVRRCFPQLEPVFTQSCEWAERLLTGLKDKESA